jgi:hypothetical protein
VEATAAAMERAEVARAVVLVEGISDQIAVETLAYRLVRHLDEEGIVVIPIGGAHGVVRVLREFGPEGRDLDVAGLCDVAEAESFRQGLAGSGFGPVETVEDMTELGFHVCVEDLEDELVRALGQEALEAVLESQGDLGSFRTLQKQPEWREREFRDQVRRFFGAGSRRKSRYARRLVEALEDDRVPTPLRAVLDAV